jgi:hypothetical protein
VVEANGGKVVGAVRVPLGGLGLLVVPAAGAILGRAGAGLANAGTDFSNSLKAANEFGITKTMKPAALLAFISDIHSLGLQTAQGLYLTTGWYWDLNDETRAFGKRYFAKMKKEPTMDQAGYYSATLHLSERGQGGRRTDPDKVMAELKKTKINDMFAKGTATSAPTADGARHVRHAGEDAAGVEVSVGLLQGVKVDEGRGGLRPDHRPVPAGQEISRRGGVAWQLPAAHDGVSRDGTIFGVPVPSSSAS